MPGPVVVAERADVLDDVGDVGLGDLALEERHLARPGSAPRAGGPRSRTTSISASLSGSAWTAATISGGSAASRASRSSIDSRRSFVWSHACPPLADARRHEGRLGDADEGFLHEQRDGGDRIEARLLESPIDRRLVGPDRAR